MGSFKFLIHVLILNVVRAAVTQAASPLTIGTTSGLVTGFINYTTPAVRQFLSIPFAQPPVGRLRFQPPVALNSGPPISATKLPPSCMQSIPTPSDFGTGFSIAGNVSEDCLYLNVYTPATATTGSLPVIIWIYGGAFISGGSNVPYQIPTNWIQRTQSHIVVTINYRLNIFGYPNARSQWLNVGLMDQRIAVEWVQNNIVSFGERGNPSQMILWGQSAGAASVGLYTYAYYNNPIVYGAIEDSGSATMLLADDPKHIAFTTVAGTVGCGNLAAAAELACMQAVPATTLENATLSYPSLFVPFADNITAFADAESRASKGQLAHFPVIMGTTTNEGALFGGYDPITCPVVKEINTRVKYGYQTYRYLFAGNFSNISPESALGATHSTELPLIFGTAGEYNGQSTAFEIALSHTMQDLWLAYAQNPQVPPAADGYYWPFYTPSIASMFEFGANNTLVQLVSGNAIDSKCAS